MSYRSPDAYALMAATYFAAACLVGALLLLASWIAQQVPHGRARRASRGLRRGWRFRSAVARVISGAGVFGHRHCPLAPAPDPTLQTVEEWLTAHPWPGDVALRDGLREPSLRP